MKVNGPGLKPSVIGVARIVNVSAVDLPSVELREELVAQFFEANPLVIIEVARRLIELGHHARTHALIRFDHPAGNRPVLAV
eukprot:scaffold126661_cov28-Tisochrysis_lutea.AAC.5